MAPAPTPMPIVPADVEAVVARLQELRDELSPQDLATLDRVFELAAAGLDASPVDEPDSADVEGFAFTPGPVEAGHEPLRRVLLGTQFSLGLGRRPAPPSPIPIPYPTTG